MTDSPAQPLPPPPFYFPLRHGRYDVAPGLTKLGKDHGGGAADAQVFQFDNTFARFRAAKLASRAESFERSVLARNLAVDVEAAAARFVAERLVAEHPRHFAVELVADAVHLHCGLTGESFRFDRDMRLAEHGRYTSSLDALACQVQEDLAVVSTSADRSHWLSFAHVCLPNGWAPEEKIGRSFADVHEPVAGMAAMNRRGDEIVGVMIGAAEGLVRFAWGVTFDDELNHHPRTPRPPFDPANPRGFLRVERQTIRGFPDHGASLFTIRTYLYDLAGLRHYPSTRDPLVAALRSMPPESLKYKGIASHADALVQWLTSP